MNHLEEQFVFTLYGIARSWRAGLDKRLRDLGLNQTGWRAISAIAINNTPLSQSDLANFLVVENATVVPLIDKLVALNLAKRTPCDKDRRVKYISLTTHGLAIYEQIRAISQKFSHELLKNTNEKKLSELVEFLLQIKSDLDKL